MRVNLLEEKRSPFKSYYFDLLFVLMNVMVVVLFYVNASTNEEAKLMNLDSKVKDLKSEVATYKPYERKLKDFLKYESQLSKYDALLSSLKEQKKAVAGVLFDLIEGVVGKDVRVRTFSYDRKKGSAVIEGEASTNEAVVKAAERLSQFGTVEFDSIKRKDVLVSFYDFVAKVRLGRQDGIYGRN